jgi:hypothetical protein
MAAEQKIEKPQIEKVVVSPSPVEKILTPEHKAETVLPLSEKKVEEKSAAEIVVAGNNMSVATPANHQQLRAKEIDAILSEGLNEIFLKMKPAEQKIFQLKGEETVTQINELLNQAKIKISKIVALIRKWLSQVTGINKFFLEQEVKIKTDKIIRLKDK